MPIALALAFSACGRGAEGKNAAPVRIPAAQIGALRHAEGFSVTRLGDSTLLTVHRPWQGAQRDYAYLLVPRAASAASIRGDTLVVPVPVARAITLTTTNIPHMQTVGALDALVGVGGGRYVCAPEVRERLADGRIRDVGDDMHLDLEALVALRPELLFTFVVGGSSDGGLAKLAETRIPAVIDGSYMEESPLGRAEWIKFTAAFFGKGAAADSAYAAVDSAYRALAALAQRAARKPTVVVGAPFAGSWWIPSGRTYVARLLADAGADYAWASDTTRGALNLDLEAVLAKAGNAEVWLNGGEWADLAAAKAQDPRFALFRAWKEGRVWNNDKRRCEGGGRDFFETGASHPDWILADLIAILHPELLPDHQLRWYRRLPGADSAKAAAR